MKWPIASGQVDTVENTGAASAGSVWVSGFAITSDGKLQIDSSATAGATDVFVGGIRTKSDGVVCAQTTAATRHVQGLPVDDEGMLYVGSGNTVTFHVGGVPLGAGAIESSSVGGGSFTVSKEGGTEWVKEGGVQISKEGG